MVPLERDVWVGQTLAGCRDSAGCGRQELGFCGGRQAQAQPHLESDLGGSFPVLPYPRASGKGHLGTPDKV